MLTLRKNAYGLVYIHTHIHIYKYTYTRIHAYTYIYIHIHTHTHTYIHGYIHIYMHVYVHIHIYVYICICTYIYIYIYIDRICTSCSEREANVYADVYNICLMYTPAHAWCSTTPVNACRLSTKMHIDSCMRAYATVQQLLCHGSYCELILSLARTSCRLSLTAHPHAARPPAGNPLPDAVRFENPFKFTLAHYAVAAAVLHKHHPIICVCAGLIQFVYGSHSRLATGVTSSRFPIPLFFRVR